MKGLGDAYVRSEFRLHKDTPKKEQLDQFFNAWEAYLDQIQMTARAKETVATGSLDRTAKDVEMTSPFQFGRDLPADVELSEDQIVQLQKLRDEATKAGKP